MKNSAPLFLSSRKPPTRVGKDGSERKTKGYLARRLETPKPCRARGSSFQERRRPPPLIGVDGADINISAGGRVLEAKEPGVARVRQLTDGGAKTTGSARGHLLLILILLLLASFVFLLILWRLPLQKSEPAEFKRTYKEKNIFATKIDKFLPEPQASLLNGMVWGYKSFLPSRFYQALKTTGTLHIVVLSGMNITILANLIAKFTIFLGRKLSCLSTILLIILFVLFVGPEPPIVRSAIMGSITMIAVFSGRQDWSLLSLLIAAGIMLIFNPQWLFSLSFQLSFLASLGIILLAPKREAVKKYQGKNMFLKIFDDLKKGFKEDFRTTLSAQIFTLPVIFYNFKQISLVAPVTNVLVGWLVPLITPLGIFLSVLGLLFSPLAYILGIILWVPLTYFIFIVEATSRLPFAFLKF